ncbi:hypothetical protein GQ473_03175 [archaeon]|nr:hypothetical protein [archaeon]
MNRNGYEVGCMYRSIYGNEILFELEKIVPCEHCTNDIQCNACGGFSLMFKNHVDARCQLGSDLKPYFILVEKSNSRW